MNLIALRRESNFADNRISDEEVEALAIKQLV